MAAPEPRLVEVAYEEVQCKSALNPVKNMMFAWSLNPYTGCEHRCAFCYVRAFERRADRPSDDRYGHCRHDAPEERACGPRHQEHKAAFRVATDLVVGQQPSRRGVGHG